MTIAKDRKDLKEFIDSLRCEWKTMWRNRIDDDLRAEGIAANNYERLFVDRGLILFATRNFKPPDFQEILKSHLSTYDVESMNPNNLRGGYRKFIQDNIIKKNSKSNRKEYVKKELEKMKEHKHIKHRGKGWLHIPNLHKDNS
jgi:hypothetical protein